MRFAHVIAPYWSDNDIRNNGGTVSYEVFQFEGQALDTVSEYVTEKFMRNMTTKFQGVYMILAEWNAVRPFPHGANLVNLGPTIRSFINKV